MTTFALPLHVPKKDPWKYREDNADEWLQRRPASESPIVQRMLADAKTEEDVAKALAYGAKVDAANRTGEVTLTVLEYEGPDLSPGAERENSMKLKGRSRPKPISPIAGSGGWKVVDLIRGDED